jgi:hypothetical protein
MNTALEYSTRVVQEGGRRCKKSTLNDLVHLTPLRIPLMNPPYDKRLPTPAFESNNLLEIKKGTCYLYPQKNINVKNNAIYITEKARETEIEKVLNKLNVSHIYKTY